MHIQNQTAIKQEQILKGSRPPLDTTKADAGSEETGAGNRSWKQRQKPGTDAYTGGQQAPLGKASDRTLQLKKGTCYVLLQILPQGKILTAVYQINTKESMGSGTP